MNESQNKKQANIDLIRLAWYTAYFSRIEKLEPLKKYVDRITVHTVEETQVMDAGKAKEVYEKKFGATEGGRNV